MEVYGFQIITVQTAPKAKSQLDLFMWFLTLIQSKM